MPVLHVITLAMHICELDAPLSLEACDRYSLPDELTANIDRCNYSIPTPVQKPLVAFSQDLKEPLLQRCKKVKKHISIEFLYIHMYKYHLREYV